MLTENQQNILSILISKRNEIKKKIRPHIWKLSNCGSHKNSSIALEECLSYLTEVAQRFDPSKSNDIVSYASWTCYNLYRISLRQSHNEERIRIPIDSINIQSIKDPSDDKTDVDWQDLRSHILKQSDKIFNNNSASKTNDRIIHFIIENYLLKIADGEDPISIDQIAAKFGVQKDKIYRILRSDVIKSFISRSIEK